ncbi:catalase family peroxidase [Methylobacterium nonmethylotrophicum]|uniref:Catalase-related peroxidase n=1 Tax=Methylobacterium nonmethylotrophicum TaxID=1141884 RepID=A0A4Z0NNK8_9HYPH|nr:catalase family peroxidase [Methylobacterium nonmethylotrophicum]TGD98044.1 catalase family peroxidase [Methylobacterium nonmethylotrophicum]
MTHARIQTQVQTKVRRSLSGCALLGAALLAAAAPASAQGAPPQDAASTAEQTIATMTKIFGDHPGKRSNHAKGVVVEGRFTASKEAASLSKASVFSGAAVPVTARFSDSTGVPQIPDGAPDANPHGLAIKFKPADGSEMDVVTNSLKFFPVATGEEFRDLLVAITRSGPDAQKPTPVEQFMAAHPAAPKALATAKTPSSFGRQTYNGVNAFVLVDAAGKRNPFRYRIVPVAGEELLSAEDAKAKGPNYLLEEMPARLAQGPVAFRVLAQIAQAGDATKDSTIPWPEDRRLVDLGTLTLTQAVPDSESAEKALLFMPNNLPDGVEVSDDPLIDARVQAYAISFGRRSQ